ncbi:hypothetical protein [Rhodococcus globerulus]|uniref:hypothetical protein n=1 Tax=Rhodococcus globerulus TaxID=33008 RepID=UPI00105D663D|nr:hypothetical protein [Rhodococcus globerulus]
MLSFSSIGYLVLVELFGGQSFSCRPQEGAHSDSQAEGGGTEIRRDVADSPYEAEDSQGESSDEPPADSRRCVRMGVENANSFE